MADQLFIFGMIIIIWDAISILWSKYFPYYLLLFIDTNSTFFFCNSISENDIL